MNRTTKLSLITLLAAATATVGTAAADPDGFRRGGDRANTRWTHVGEVGTHSHDAEDFVSIHTKQRFERLALTAEGRPVRLDAIDVQFVDGRKYRIQVRETLHPGRRVMVDVPSYSPIKMLVLDYGNRGPTYRAREDARVQISGLTSSYRHDQRVDRRNRGRIQPRHDDRYDNRFQWKGGVYIRLGS